jgi:hypothetical protein
VLVYSRNIVAFAAVMGNAGMAVFVESPLISAAWYLAHQST